MIDIYGDGPAWLRIIGFFFGCSHHAAVHHRDVPLMSIQKCVLRVYHRGEHRYPAPWLAALPDTEPDRNAEPRTTAYQQAILHGDTDRRSRMAGSDDE